MATTAQRQWFRDRLQQSREVLVLFPIVGDELEREMLYVGLNLATDETLRTKDDVGGVHRDLFLRGVTDETLYVQERDIKRGGVATLVAGDDLDTVVLPGNDIRVGGSEIDSDSF